MGLLNKIVAYWYDCIKNEDILGKDISIHVRKKAVLYPFDRDPFIFDRGQNPIKISISKKLTEFCEYVKLSGYEIYYGYPILFYYDEDDKRHKIAPIFVIKLKHEFRNNDFYLKKEELTPTCGILAFDRLGLHTEEVSDINERIEKLFRSEYKLTPNELAKRCLEIIQEEVRLEIKEKIVPEQLTNSQKLSKNSLPGVYNKSLIFAGENTQFNFYLLQDLAELKNRKDLDKTALSFFVEDSFNTLERENNTPDMLVLPFPCNSFQTQAIQSVFRNKLTVITGPPGTGKSQLICNLLVNLFLRGKTALLVSHTNEAVNVVGRKNKQPI